MTPSLKVVVGSTNGVKITAGRETIAAYHKDTEIEAIGVAAKSGVSDQPMSDQETLQGARARVNHSKALQPGADYYVAFEGGVEVLTDGRLSQFAWVVIEAKDGTIGEARTAAFCLPNKIARLVKEGYELGVADDMVFGKTDSKKSGGSVGLLTDDRIVRSQYYQHAGLLAMIPHYQKELYKQE